METRPLLGRGSIQPSRAWNRGFREAVAQDPLDRARAAARRSPRESE